MIEGVTHKTSIYNAICRTMTPFVTPFLSISVPVDPEINVSKNVSLVFCVRNTSLNL